MVTIYKITSPSNRIYIGQSFDFERRKVQYKRNKCKAQTLLYNSLLKYGYENHIFEIIEITTKELADERETFWIKEYDCFNTKNGLNLTPGGKRPLIKKGKEHYKAKIIYQYSLEGEFIKEWKCIKDIESELGYNSSCIGRSANTSGYGYGFIWSFTLKEFSNYIRNHSKRCKGKSILQYDLDDNFIKEYDSISSASKELKICKRTIKNSLNNKKLKSNRTKYKWFYSK